MTYLPEYLRHDVERKKSDGYHCVDRDEKHGAVGAFHRRLNVPARSMRRAVTAERIDSHDSGSNR